MSKDVVTTKDFNKAKEEWLKKKAESNKKSSRRSQRSYRKKKKKSIIGLSMKIKSRGWDKSPSLSVFWIVEQDAVVEWSLLR